MSVFIVYYGWYCYLPGTSHVVSSFCFFSELLVQYLFHIRIQAASFPSACKVQELKDSMYLLTIVFALQNKWEYIISLLSQSFSPGFYWPLSQSGLPQNSKEDRHEQRRKFVLQYFMVKKLILQQLNHLLKFILYCSLGLTSIFKYVNHWMLIFNMNNFENQH